MSRDKFIPKRTVLPDIRYNSTDISKFINVMMIQGKKSVSQKIMYTALREMEAKIGKPAVEVFTKSIDNIRPLVEVKSRRVGGATYQVPMEVDEARGKAIAIRWVIINSRKRSERTMALKLANELLDGYNKTGTSYKKKEDSHKMAEANKAFSHFRW